MVEKKMELDKPVSKDRIVLVGAGRSPLTRDLRRQANFKRRSFRIGGILVRPNLRVEVNTRFVALHEKAVMDALESGTILVYDYTNKRLDADELLLVLGITPDKPKTEKQDKAKSVEEQAEEQKREDKETSVEAKPSEETAVQAKPELVENQESEPAAASEAKPEKPADPEKLEIDAGEVVETEPKRVQEEPPASEEPDYSKMTKRELLALCAERGIVVEGRIPNTVLISKLKTS